MEVCYSDVQDKSFHDLGDFDDSQEEIQNLYVSINLNLKIIYHWKVYNLGNSRLLYVYTSNHLRSTEHFSFYS